MSLVWVVGKALSNLGIVIFKKAQYNIFTMSVSIRDNDWLLSRLEYLWLSFFNDVTEVNPLIIRFGRHSKFRLGSIKLDRRSNRSYMTITGMFKNPKIPIEIVDHTIAHELVHYAHGFSSKRVRLHRYPHAGGIVQKEMKKRGMENLIKAYRSWMKEYRRQLISYER